MTTDGCHHSLNEFHCLIGYIKPNARAVETVVVLSVGFEQPLNVITAGISYTTYPLTSNCAEKTAQVCLVNSLCFMSSRMSHMSWLKLVFVMSSQNRSTLVTRKGQIYTAIMRRPFAGLVKGSCRDNTIHDLLSHFLR